jgi:hypothetical protein
MFARTMYVMVIVTMVFSMTGIVFAEEDAPSPNPYIEAFAWYDQYSLVDWPAGIPVLVTITNPDYVADVFTPDTEGGWYNFYPGVDLHSGTQITATNGNITKVLEISQLSATANPVSGEVTGVATPNGTFHMKTDGDRFQLPIEQDIPTSSDGTWSVTIDEYLPWEWFTRGEMWEGDDDGDVTHAIWHVKQNIVEVWLSQNEIRAFGWPRDTELTFNVDGVDIGTAFTQPVDWFEGTWAVINAGEYGVQLEPGMTVMVTGAGVPPKSLVVQDIMITNVDVGSDVVYGYAPPNADLELGSWEDSPVFRFFNNGDDTNWTVDYKEMSLNGVTVDINPGDELRLFMRDEEKNATVWGTAAPNPFIAVSLTQHWFWVNSYAPEKLVTFSIYDNQGDETPILEFSKPTDSSGNLNLDGWEHIWDPEPGDYIVATDGLTTKDLVLENITLEVSDPVNNLVWGYTVGGREVGVGVGNEKGEQWMNVLADEVTGKWIAQFEFGGEDYLTENSWASGNVGDEDGDITSAHNSGPSESPAWFTVFPELEAVEAWDFPIGAVVHLIIDDPATKLSPDYEQDEPVTFTPWGSWQLWVWFDFAGKYNVKAGDVVTLTYGETVRTHTVQNLAVTKVNHEDDTIKGTASAGAEIHVWPHATGQEEIAIANPNGKWNVSFSGVYDLKPGEDGRAEIRDEMGNATAVDWHIPRPRIVASITEDWFYVQEFTPNTAVNYYVYKGQGQKLISKGAATTDNSGFVWIDPIGWNLEPGNYLVVKDGPNTKALIVEGFTFDVFNLSNGQLSGTAPEPYGRKVWVGIGWDNNGWSADVFTDGEGNWSAGYGAPIANGFGWVAAQIFDGDGDATELRPAQIYPTIFAWLEWDVVDGHGWREGETVTLTINNGEHVLYQVVGTTKLVFDLKAEGHDLTIGDQISMSDGLITKQLLIPDLKITDYDLGAKTVSGTYDSNLGFRTYVNGQGPAEITFDGNTWKAYFENLGPLLWGDAVQRDVDSDEVAATINTPNPNLYALPDENKIFAQGWIAGFDLKLTIYNSIGEVLHTDTKMVEPPSVVPWTVVIFDGFDIEPGQRIVLNQRGYERELLVSSLMVTGFDYANQQVIGIGDAGAQIFIRINGKDVWGEVDENGNWAISHPQLTPGVWGEAIQPDGVDGDETRDGFQAP